MCSEQVMAKVRESVSRRRFLGMMGVAALGAASQVDVAEARSVERLDFRRGFAVQDLTHVVGPEFPVFPGSQTMEITTIVTIPQNGFYANEVVYHTEHTGTHMDAPAHFAEGGLTADELPAEQLFAPLAVIDIAARASQDPDAEVTVDDVLGWERRHGRLPRGAFVAMYSGWEHRLPDAAQFLNQDAGGTMHFPGFSPEAAEFLVSERTIVGIGVDTLSLDFGASTDFGTHLTVLPAGKYGLENLANLALVPASGAMIVVGGPKHRDASGGPTRAFAMYPGRGRR